MRLSNLIAPIKGANLQGSDADISGISADSRAIEQGSLFMAVSGLTADGRAFIQDAVAKGAVAVMVEEGTDIATLPQGASYVTVPNARAALSAIAATFYPRQPQTIAAVTGTSGKTSTVQFTRDLWTQGGKQAASLGTLGLIAPQVQRYGSLTTPDPITLHKTLDEIAAQGVTHVAMEASSHGIEFNRLDHVAISLAAFTNLSRDHLDYHKTMDDYFAAKLRLFTTLLADGGTAIINADVPEFADVKAACETRGIKVMCFGRSGCHLLLKANAPETGGQRMRFELLGKPYEITLPLIGEFQIWNSLCALTLAIASGEDQEIMVQAMEKLAGVAGRLEKIGTTPSGGVVFVDYAHKPAALENVLAALRPHVTAHGNNAKLRVVFGCGGNRDKGKRPLMGNIAQSLADDVIVTDDNPRHEIAASIRQEILAACVPCPHLKEIGNRAEAIQAGIESLKEGDVLVIAGKGHEEGQIVGDQVLPFNDADEARKVLNGL
ncbi:MAG: UDP-N-acetylmuramoyl-L-alanyl-D-glutamate--2,6-diaminopimelate ligase [Bdellovibrionales bacterium]